MTELAKKYYPYLPVKILLRDKYDTIKKLKLVNSPILVMHGENDTIVPPMHLLEAKEYLKRYSLNDVVDLLYETEKINKKQIYQICLNVKNEKNT